MVLLGIAGEARAETTCLPASTDIPTNHAARERALACQSIASYDLAAAWHERFATSFPTESDAPEAMLDAMILRLGLGDLELAARDRTFFVKTWGASRPNESARAVYLFAAHQAERGEEEKARALLASSMALIDRASLDLRIQAHALAASVAITPASARREHETVLALWADPANAEQAIRRAWPAEERARHDRRLARALTAVGKAMVALADERRIAEVEALAFPAYTGSNDPASIETFARGKVKPWSEKRRAAIERIEPLYLRVLDVRPVPPPLAVVAAGAAIGKMWGDLADDMRRAPVPAVWRRDPTLAKAYTDAVAEAVDPILRGRAKPAMKKCVELSAKYEVTSEASRACEAWLVMRYPLEVHRVDELVPILRVDVAPPRMTPLPFE